MSERSRELALIQRRNKRLAMRNQKNDEAPKEEFEPGSAASQIHFSSSGLHGENKKKSKFTDKVKLALYTSFFLVILVCLLIIMGDTKSVLRAYKALDRSTVTQSPNAKMQFVIDYAVTSGDLKVAEAFGVTVDDMNTYLSQNGQTQFTTLNPTDWGSYDGVDIWEAARDFASKYNVNVTYEQHDGKKFVREIQSTDYANKGDHNNAYYFQAKGGSYIGKEGCEMYATAALLTMKLNRFVPVIEMIQKTKGTEIYEKDGRFYVQDNNFGNFTNVGMNTWLGSALEAYGFAKPTSANISPTIFDNEHYYIVHSKSGEKHMYAEDQHWFLIYDVDSSGKLYINCISKYDVNHQGVHDDGNGKYTTYDELLEGNVSKVYIYDK